MNKKFTRLKKVNNFDYYLMQRVEDIKIRKNSLILKLRDRKTLVFKKVKIDFIDLKVFEQNILYFHSLKIILGKVSIFFDDGEKLFDITFNMTK